MKGKKENCKSVYLKVSRKGKVQSYTYWNINTNSLKFKCN